jgi:hypothetical protein
MTRPRIGATHVGRTVQRTSPCQGCIGWLRSSNGWLLGAHQGAVQPSQLDYYLDEFTFRFNRRTSRSRGLLFYRLLEQAVVTQPVTYQRIVARRV